MSTWNLFLGSINIAPYIVMVSGYLFTMLTSGLVVRLFVSSGGKNSEVEKEAGKEDGKEEETVKSSIFEIGTIIGKCENFIALTFILSSEYTGLAIIFTAKSIVRMDAIKKNPKYFLGGTLINLCYSILMGFLIRAILRNIGYFL